MTFKSYAISIKRTILNIYLNILLMSRIYHSSRTYILHQLSVHDTYCQHTTPTVSTRHLLSAHDTYCQHTTPTVSTRHLLSAHDTYCQHTTPTVSTRHLLSAHDTHCQHMTHTVRIAYCHATVQSMMDTAVSAKSRYVIYLTIKVIGDDFNDTLLKLPFRP
jgi:hypothetical protein